MIRSEEEYEQAVRKLMDAGYTREFAKKILFWDRLLASADRLQLPCRYFTHYGNAGISGECREAATLRLRRSERGGRTLGKTAGRRRESSLTSGD